MAVKFQAMTCSGMIGGAPLRSRKVTGNGDPQHSSPGESEGWNGGGAANVSLGPVGTDV